jgi:hypothetical protein
VNGSPLVQPARDWLACAGRERTLLSNEAVLDLNVSGWPNGRFVYNKYHSSYQSTVTFDDTCGPVTYSRVHFRVVRREAILRYQFGVILIQAYDMERYKTFRANPRPVQFAPSSRCFRSNRMCWNVGSISLIYDGRCKLNWWTYWRNTILPSLHLFQSGRFWELILTSGSWDRLHAFVEHLQPRSGLWLSPGYSLIERGHSHFEAYHIPTGNLNALSL